MSELHVRAHVGKADFEAYVINALALERAAEVEDHVARCEACAEALAREARLELAMELVVERVEVAPAASRAEGFRAAAAPPGVVRRVRPSRGQRVASGPLASIVVGSLAAAAVVALWMVPVSRTEGADEVARHRGVSADASGSMMAADAWQKPDVDTLDGG